MTLPATLDEQIHIERQLVTTIKDCSRRRTFPILRRVLLTLAIPYAFFMLAWIGGDRLREIVAVTFNDSNLNSTMTVLRLAVIFVGTFYIWKWTERQFRGLALARRLLWVSRAVLDVEQAIDSARRQSTPAQSDLDTIRQLTDRAWDAFTRTMAEFELPVQDSELDLNLNP